VHDSLMNDAATRDATVMAIQEPQARRIQGRLLTTPMGHHKWTKMVPSTWREGRWAIRSMLWVKKDVEAEQVPVDSPDITAAVIRLPDNPAAAPCSLPRCTKEGRKRVWLAKNKICKRVGATCDRKVTLLLFLHRYALGRAGPSAIYYTGKPHPCGPDEKPVSEIKETIRY
jgi:hypothetical protein